MTTARVAQAMPVMAAQISTNVSVGSQNAVEHGSEHEACQDYSMPDNAPTITYAPIYIYIHIHTYVYIYIYIL